MSLHTSLKKWLIELGENYTYNKKRYYQRCYSGDSEPIDVRKGKRHIEYQPDVIFERNGRLSVIELAFEEDWRAIAGEICLCSLSGRVDSLLIIRFQGINPDPDYIKVKRLVSILNEIYWQSGVVKHGVGSIFLPEGVTLQKGKTIILGQLKRLDWID